jgi:predicted phage replisome organizer
MADVKWIKITTDVFDDEKILMIESMPECDTIIVIWFKLLCLAGKQNNGGVFQMGQIPYTDEMFAAIFRRPINTVRLALQTFERFGMIEIVRDTVTIPNWGKHQSLDAYEKKKERDRLYQAERRAAQRALIEKSSDTSSYVASLEEEREEDGEKEEDISFIHSCVRESENDDLSTSLSTAEEKKRKILGGELGKGVVLLSQEQIDDLLDKLSLEEFDYYVGVVADCILKGKKYTKKTHYQAILDMAAKDRRVKTK